MDERGTDSDLPVRLHDPDTVARAGVALFGRVLQPSEWAEAVGAPTGATVNVSVEAQPEESDPEVVVRVDHPLLVGSMERRFRRTVEDIVVRNVHFHVHDQAPAGFGTAVFARQVAGLRRLGVSRIEAEIAGSAASPYNGYYTWARMGFDAPLTAAERRQLPPHLVGARTLHERITAPGGREWWRRRGSGREAVFDLSPMSPHGAILRAYLEEREARGG
jgi:hypothetical protein